MASFPEADGHREVPPRSNLPAMLSVYLDQYSKIMASFDACRTFSYVLSPHLLVPRFALHSPVLTDHGRYLTVGNAGSAPGLIPVSLASPAEYLDACIEVIHRYGGVYDVSRPYAKALARQGYGAAFRPWGALDFVFSTEHIIALPGGRHKGTRNDCSSLERRGITRRWLGPDDGPAVDALEATWAQTIADKGQGNGTRGYARTYLQAFPDLPDTLEAKALGLFDQDQLVGVTIANRLTASYWCCGYGYGDMGYRSIVTHGFRHMAQAYRHLAYEADGHGGAVGSGLYVHKSRMITEDVRHLQSEKYVVSR
jgi:hypothetical protein